MSNLRLRDLAVGSRGRITGFADSAQHYKRQLLAMGLTPGTEFTVLRLAPMGDPVELHVRGFDLTLRKAEADALKIEHAESKTDPQTV
ncbi:MAG: FeoA family protein [Cyanobacteria bacterium J06638_22]